MSLSEKETKELTENIEFIKENKQFLDSDSDFAEKKLTHEMIREWLTYIDDGQETFSRLCNKYNLAIDEEGFALDSEYQKIDEGLQLNNVFNREYEYEDEDEENSPCLMSIEEFYKRLKNVEKVLNSIGCHDVKVFQSNNNFNIKFSRIETNEEFAIRIAQTVREIKYNIKREKARDRRAQKKMNQDLNSLESKRKEYEKLKALFEKENKK